MGTLSVITAPTLEPVALNEVKSALRVDVDTDDTRLMAIIKASREFAEDYLDRHLMSQVVELTFDTWPSSEIRLDVWPLQSIDSIKYDDTSSPVTEQTLVVNTDYYADTTTMGGRVRPVTNWPSVAVKPNPIRIRMTAGYANQAAVPEQIKEGIKAYCAFLYEGNCFMEAVAKTLLWSQRRL